VKEFCLQICQYLVKLRVSNMVSNSFLWTQCMHTGLQNKTSNSLLKETRTLANVLHDAEYIRR